ncbi:hypothetical protein TSUD_79720 [Trifolium subterraneum]|uniref:Uncharacterized protein n=1 Tax=Trifolium subterraneum TaxID=3900 RepID=A0A2Z6LM80_TRISU|nr:hypothetical protein TSUD_79720 [Trifolium subterraneum]
MAYQNRKHNYGWGHIHEILEPTSYPRHHHHQKRHVETYEEPIVEVDQSYYVDVRRETDIYQEDSRYGYQNRSTTYERVDEEAEAFIQHEHRRTALAKLMSSMK